jgi:hypothetical protein
MSEVINETHNTGTNDPGTVTEEPTPVLSTSKLNLAIESVITLINEMGNFATMTRGALGISNGLTCEIAPSVPYEVYYDKNAYLTVTLALNGKHSDLRTLTDTMNNIIDTMTRRTSYPSGNGWEVVDITGGNLPRVIGREDNNLWLVAGDMVVKIYRKDDESNESELGESD